MAIAVALFGAWQLESREHCLQGPEGLLHLAQLLLPFVQLFQALLVDDRQLGGVLSHSS